MTDYGNVRSISRPQPTVIDEYSVWVSTDIREITVNDDEGGIGEHTEYEFRQVRYTKDEYIKRMDEKNAALESQLTDTQLALCDVYEMIGGD